MIITTSRTARVDQLHAEVRDARSYDGHSASCDALGPCAGCKAKAREVRMARRFADAGEILAPRAPQPRTGDLRARLARR